MGGIISRIIECCGVGRGGGSTTPRSTTPLIPSSASSVLDMETRAEERRLRALLRQALLDQQRSNERLARRARQQERRRLQRDEVLQLQENWRRAVAAGEARRPRGLGELYSSS